MKEEIALKIDVSAHVFKEKDKIEEVLKNIELEIKKGEFLILLGPSGCGKTTLLNLVGGFLQPTRGQISRGNGEIIRQPGKERGMIFQSLGKSLFPWLNVYENTAYGLRMAGKSEKEIGQTVKESLKKVNLEAHQHKYPPDLSGGMQQRVQIARVLANDPEILLMDEPFASLDAQTRKLMQQEFVDLWRGEKRTVIFVTHSIMEATKLGQRIVTMTAGPNSTVKNIHDVSLDYPRDKTSEEFLSILEQIEEEIKEEVKASIQRAQNEALSEPGLKS